MLTQGTSRSFAKLAKHVFKVSPTEQGRVLSLKYSACASIAPNHTIETFEQQKIKWHSHQWQYLNPFLHFCALNKLFIQLKAITVASPMPTMQQKFKPSPMFHLNLHTSILTRLASGSSSESSRIALLLSPTEANP